MQRTILGLALISLLAAPAAAQDGKKPTTLMEKVSYGIGQQIGKNFSKDGIKIDVTWLSKGVSDGLDEDAKSLLSDAEMRAAMNDFRKEMVELQKRKLAEAKLQGEKNKAAGEKFLAANAKKEGVKTTDSGLQYKVLKRGNGATPKSTDTVKVHYRGSLIDGKQFETSIGGEPAQFRVNGVIPGWTEALQLMKVGDKFQLFIPSDLAYGEQGGPGGPNSTLIFEVELLEIVK